MPRKPSSAIRSTISVGQRALLSSSAALGSISRFAKSRAVWRTSCWSSVRSKFMALVGGASLYRLFVGGSSGLASPLVGGAIDIWFGGGRGRGRRLEARRDLGRLALARSRPRGRRGARGRRRCVGRLGRVNDGGGGGRGEDGGGGRGAGLRLRGAVSGRHRLRALIRRPAAQRERRRPPADRQDRDHQRDERPGPPRARRGASLGGHRDLRDLALREDR